jgi:hypothetical protein
MYLSCCDALGYCRSSCGCPGPSPRAGSYLGELADAMLFACIMSKTPPSSSENACNDRIRLFRSGSALTEFFGLFRASSMSPSLLLPSLFDSSGICGGDARLRFSERARCGVTLLCRARLATLTLVPGVLPFTEPLFCPILPLLGLTIVGFVLEDGTVGDGFAVTLRITGCRRLIMPGPFCKGPTEFIVKAEDSSLCKK